jgi:hypothetical protein
LKATDATNLATASAREKHWRAELAELNYKQRAGELVNAAEMTAAMADAFSTVRTKLLGLPSKAKQQLPHLTLAELATLDEIVREALEGLSQRRSPGDRVMRTAAAVVADARTALRPPPRLTLSAWADDKFYLSAESAAEPGRWSTLPYQREPMDAFTDPHVEQITFLKSARVGYTKMINAAIGYHVDHDPCAILVIQPDEDDAKGYAKEEIEPMIRDCPAVGEKFGAFTLKNSMLHKRFRGGFLQLAGARSPGNFRRVSRRVVIGDEVDGYPPSAGHEGDPSRSRSALRALLESETRVGLDADVCRRQPH